MRLALLSSIVPDANPTTGFEIANRAILEGLRRAGHEVDVFGFAQPRQEIEESPGVHVLGRFSVENAGASALARTGFLLRALRTGLPVSAAKLTRVSEREVLARLDAAGPFDALVLNSYQMGCAFPALTRRPYVFVAHNVEHVSAEQNAQSTDSGLMRSLYQRDARLLRAEEKRQCRLARHVFTLAEEDRVTLGVTRDEGTFLPLVIPARPRKARARRTHDVGLLGTWTWQPNYIGLEWFVREVMPRLRADITVAVAGATPLKRPKSDRVDWLGRVPDADAFLSGLAATALISRGGTGVQLKTIEAFSSGLACVATRASVRGVDAVPAGCTLADDPETFARALEDTVDRSRKGEGRGDGAAFVRAQQQAMDQALATGFRRAFGTAAAEGVQASSTSVR